MENGDKECWGKCNSKEGKCDWCGPNGLCCRKHTVGNGCDGTIGGPGNHQCDLNPTGKYIVFLGLQNQEI